MVSGVRRVYSGISSIYANTVCVCVRAYSSQSSLLQSVVFATQSANELELINRFEKD